MDISGDSDVQFGVGKKNGPTNDGTDTTTTFVDGVGGTYLLVLAYQQVAGEDNDEVKLYVDPEISINTRALLQLPSEGDNSNWRISRIPP